MKFCDLVNVFCANVVASCHAQIITSSMRSHIIVCALFALNNGAHVTSIDAPCVLIRYQ